MLLESNTEKVKSLVGMVDNLKGIDKIRLAIQILENLYFSTEYDVDGFIKLLKEILGQLDPDYNKTIINFAKYKNILFISAKFSELSLIEKQQFSVEMLFNIFEYDFKNQEINTKISKRLNVYDYCYSLKIL